MRKFAQSGHPGTSLVSYDHRNLSTRRLMLKKGDFFSWSPTYLVLQGEILLSSFVVNYLGWTSADFLRGFLRQKCLKGQGKHTRSSVKISMATTATFSSKSHIHYFPCINSCLPPLFSTTAQSLRFAIFFCAMGANS
jgi:hypothetical protein